MLYSAIRTLLAGGHVNLTSIVAQIISVLFIAIFILPLHECAHGIVAVKLGDNTPKWDRRLTLNPLASLDPMGAMWLLLFGIGWAKPVQVNARNFKNPKRDMAIVALAGPVSNILAALVGAIIFVPYVIFVYSSHSNVVTYFIYYFLSSYITVNVSLAVFNFIPIPPLDGSRIVAAFLSDNAMYTYYRYQNIIMPIFFVILLSGVLSTPLAYAESYLTQGIVWLAMRPYVLFGLI
jgi:Zn-dependent protease